VATKAINGHEAPGVRRLKERRAARLAGAALALRGVCIEAELRRWDVQRVRDVRSAASSEQHRAKVARRDVRRKAERAARDARFEQRHQQQRQQKNRKKKRRRRREKDRAKQRRLAAARHQGGGGGRKRRRGRRGGAKKGAGSQ